MRRPHVRRWLFAVGVALVVAGIASWLFSDYQLRETARESAALIDALELASDSRVADVGAGNGGYTVALAQTLTSGFVYATEIDLGNLATIERTVEAAGLTNVTLIEARTSETGLPPDCCDGIFLRHVYHHLTDPDTVVADLFRALRPGGRLAVIDFRPEGWLSFLCPVEGVRGDRGGHGVPPAVVIEEMTAAGFQLDRQIDDWSRRSFGLIFVRPDGKGTAAPS